MQISPILPAITWSARALIIGGIVKPRAFAAVRLMTSSKVAACCTGSSPGDAPFRRFGAKPDKKIVDRQAVNPSS